LDVPSDWLRFGNENGKGKGQPGQLSAIDLRLVNGLQQLDESQRQLAHEILRLIVRLNKKK